uniref:Uncharacterized protein n=1 Tax=Rhizochromulina marina TaxID=1034831 RepID=A0A7S2WR09_9STRA
MDAIAASGLVKVLTDAASHANPLAVVFPGCYVDDPRAAGSATTRKRKRTAVGRPASYPSMNAWPPPEPPIAPSTAHTALPLWCTNGEPRDLAVPQAARTVVSTGTDPVAEDLGMLVVGPESCSIGTDPIHDPSMDVGTDPISSVSIGTDPMQELLSDPGAGDVALHISIGTDPIEEADWGALRDSFFSPRELVSTGTDPIMTATTPFL